MYQQVSPINWSIYSTPVEWKTIRSAYERAFADAKARGETQETVAERGGIRQNDVSRMFQNDKKGPRVVTFIKAVKGLRDGMTLTEFFLQIERQTDSDLSTRVNEGRSGRTPGGKATVPSGGPGSSLPSDHDIRHAVGQALLSAAAALTDTATAGATEPVDRKVPPAGVKKHSRS